jgi:excisionase family DNA binding protein
MVRNEFAGMKASLVFDSHGKTRRYLSIAQVAQILSVHRRTIERWVREKKIEAHQPFGNCIRIPAEQVERLLENTNIGKSA